ncbi:MAG: HAD-IIIA family hydrolase [Planctomycetes bacterium]|nr:HAD-IIIA family hydrolase [Planctomycetota bacterium]
MSKREIRNKSEEDKSKSGKPKSPPSTPKAVTILGDLKCRLGLGLLRLCTEGRPSEADAVAVIHFALDYGIRILDTADVYCLDESDLHYGERLVRAALDSWKGPRDEVRILTKVGLARPKGRWMPRGKPEQLRKAVDRSLEALGVERLFLLQLHARDPQVPFEEILATLAELQKQGKVEHLGLCNIGPGEFQQAMRHFPIAAVQNELSVLNRKSATDGMVELTRQKGVPFLAHRPLGGYAKVARLAKDKVLAPLAERHKATPHEIALATLLDAAPHVVPLSGATRVESVRSSLAALGIKLDVSDRTALSVKFPFTPGPDAVSALTPTATPVGLPTLGAGAGPGDKPEVVILMGIQGAGKSQLVSEYVDKGYVRLNRDIEGGKLDDLIPRLREHLASGRNRVVLDNTYPSRLSRAPVIAVAHAHGVPVRCRNLQTPPGEARINIVIRMLRKYDKLLGPDDMKVLAKTDPNLPPPAALARWIGSYETPALDEGFSAVDPIPFVRQVDPGHTRKGLLLDVDGTLRRTRSGEIYPRDPDDVELLPGRRDTLARWIDAGYLLFFVSNQSGIASAKLSREAADAAFRRTVELLKLPVADIAYCPHPAFPVGCFCRKPFPGLGVMLMERHRLARDHLVVVGDMKSDADFAAELGAKYHDTSRFFDLNGPNPC